METDVLAWAIGVMFASGCMVFLAPALSKGDSWASNIFAIIFCIMVAVVLCQEPVVNSFTEWWAANGGEAAHALVFLGVVGAFSVAGAVVILIVTIYGIMINRHEY